MRRSGQTSKYIDRAEKKLPVDKIKQPKKDVFKDGATRALIEVDSVLRPVGTFSTWTRLAFQDGDGKSTAFGGRLRERVSAIMKTAALANRVRDARIDTHSLRSGGATALYAQGVPLDVIQRWARWKSLTSHQYLRHDATALNKLSEVFTRSYGLLKSLGLTNVKHKSVSRQHQAVGEMSKPGGAVDPKE